MQRNSRTSPKNGLMRRIHNFNLSNTTDKAARSGYADVVVQSGAMMLYFHDEETGKGKRVPITSSVLEELKKLQSTKNQLKQRLREITNG